MAKPTTTQVTLLATMAAVSLLLLLRVGDAADAAVRHDVQSGHGDRRDGPSFINYEDLRADLVPGRRGLDRPVARASKFYWRGCEAVERCRGSQ